MVSSTHFFYQGNLAALRRRYPRLAESLAGCQSYRPIDIVVSKSGTPTIRVWQNGMPLFLHSRYDPEAEAERWAEANAPFMQPCTALYGLGLGYHIRALLRQASGLKRLTVLQLGYDLLEVALRAVDLRDIINDSHIELAILSNSAELACMMSRLETDDLLMYLPAVRAIPDEFSEAQEALLSYNVRRQTTLRFARIVHQNIEQADGNNIYRYPDISVFFPHFVGLPMILVAAGPSLDYSLAELAGLEDKALMMAVGTAARPLLHAGIRPHFIIVLDPQEIVWKQLEGIESIPLIVFPSVHPKVVNSYRGPIVVAYQQGLKMACSVAKEWQVETGGSVATAALDILIKWGGDPIIFVGQDLAYPNGRTHASHSIYGNESVAAWRGMTVEGLDGRPVPTSRSLNIYRRWIERRIAREAGRRRFINATAAGARIQGVKEIGLAELKAKILTTNWPVLRNVVTNFWE